MSITIADVARRAEVSKATVSRVINNKPDVSPATAARVRRVIEELGFVPSPPAVALARGRTGTVGMVVPFDDPSVPRLLSQWMAELLQGAADAVAMSGYRLRLFTYDDSEQSLRRLAAQVTAQAVDGLLVVEPEGALVERVIDIYQSGLPVVLINDRNHQLLPSVTTTNGAGGRAAAGHLRELDRCRPLVITGPAAFSCTRQRLAGFLGVYAKAGLPVAPEYVVDGAFTFAGGVRAVRNALADGREFDAVFAHNDLSAAGALQAIRTAGRDRSLDVALVGFDDVPLAQQAGHAMSTVRQPLREMGETAARVLVRQLDEGPVAETEVVIPTSLVIRRTAVTL